MLARVFLAQRFDRTPDGRVWTLGTFDLPFWGIYLTCFDEVRVVARVRDVEAVDPSSRPASGEAVRFEAVPHYIGPGEFARRLPAVASAVLRSVRAGDAHVFRVPSVLASIAIQKLRRGRHPYALEVVADPYDIFAPGAIRHPLRPLLRRLFTQQVRAQCASAEAVSYVTGHALQARYPTRGYGMSISDILLGEDAFAPGPRAYTRPARSLVFVGSLEQMYKGPDVLLDAIARLASRGSDVRVTMVGGGRCQGSLERQARALGIGGRVRFMGMLPAGAAVREQLDAADLFVLPSRTEGLPRAVIEAMARGLPCIGSAVGGIPELIAADELVPPGDASALARKIEEVGTPARMAALSERNLRLAAGYADSVLIPRRRAFYAEIRDRTERWRRSRGPQGASSTS